MMNKQSDEFILETKIKSLKLPEDIGLSSVKLIRDNKEVFYN